MNIGNPHPESSHEKESMRQENQYCEYIVGCSGNKERYQESTGSRKLIFNP